MESIVNDIRGMKFLENIDSKKHIYNEVEITYKFKILEFYNICDIKEFLHRFEELEKNLIAYLIKEVCMFLYVEILENSPSYTLIINYTDDKYDFLTKNNIFNSIKIYSHIRSLNYANDISDYSKIQKLNDLILDKCMMYGNIKEGNEWYIKAYTKYVNIYIDMFNDFFCKMEKEKKKISINKFIINIFDHPIIHKKCKYFVGYCDVKQVLEKPVMPVLSGATTSNHYDLLLPYTDVWELSTQRKFYVGDGGIPKNGYLTSEISKLIIDWDKKKPILVFKGRNTGCFPNDVEKNSRLNAYYNIIKYLIELTNIGIKMNVDLTGIIRINYLSIDDKNSQNDKYDYNVEYTNFLVIKNNLLKKLDADKTILEEKKLSIKNYIENRLPTDNQSKYSENRIEQSLCKYMLNIDGFVTAWRLPCDFANKSVVLFAKNPLEEYTSYFYNLLQDNVNYVKLDTNMNDLVKKMEYLKNNDEVAKKIAENGYELYKMISNTNNLLKYIEHVFTNQNNDMDIKDWIIQSGSGKEVHMYGRSNSWKQKYIKYKQKYLSLKNIFKQKT